MEREIMPDYAAEAFYRYLIPENVFEDADKPQEEVKHRAVFCEKVAPQLFPAVKVAVKGGNKNFFNDEVAMITPSAKLAYGFEIT